MLTSHLKSRHLDIELHKPLLDEEKHVATFLLYNLSGQVVGFQQYRPNASKTKSNDPREGRYFTYKGVSKVAVFGVESLHLTPGIVFVTEGVFDAARLTSKGVSALAVLSNNPTSDVRNFLRSLGRLVVAVCDNDSAGRKLASVGHVAVTLDGKDLGDSTDEEVENLLRNFL